MKGQCVNPDAIGQDLRCVNDEYVNDECVNDECVNFQSVKV